MDDAKKQEIIAAIAKQHSLVIPKDDPIFAVTTICEILFDEYVGKVEKNIGKNATEIEGMMSKYLADAKELAEIKIGAAVKETYKVLDERHKKALTEIEIATKAATSAIAEANTQTKNNYFFIASVAIVATLIGVVFGKLL